MAALEGNLAAKADNICKLIAGWEREAVAIQAEMDRLKARKDACGRSQAALKGYFKTQLELIGQQRIKTDLFSVWIQANSRPRITWEGPGYPPADFQRLRPPELDGEAAYHCLKATGSLPEGFKVEEGSHLQIR